MGVKGNGKKRIAQLLFLAVLVVGTTYVIKDNRKPYQHNQGFIFGTTYNIIYQSDDDLESELVAELNKVDNSMSMFNNKSVITQVNNSKDIEVDEMFIEVFNCAKQISAATDGAFDFTVAPLINAWGFGFKQGIMPTKSQVDSLLQMVDYRKVEMSGKRIKKANPNTMLDFSAIAKGYGCDIVTRQLQRRGITNFMIEIGGEIVAQGISEKGEAWKIGITKPVDDNSSLENELQAILHTKDLAMATSGNYRNFYVKDGKKYAHTIDPRTGYPVQHNILSATVVAPRCAIADGYATSFMVMGLEKAKEILKKHSELKAYIIYSDDKGKMNVWLSPELKQMLD